MAKKTTKEVTKLDPIKVKAIEKAVKKGEIPVIKVEGDCATRYNGYAAIKDDADGQMKELKRVMLPDALTELFRHNSERPWEPLSSVKIEDEAKSQTRVTFMAKYSFVAPVVIEALFGNIKTVKKVAPDVNDYFTKTMVGEFNSDVFLNAEGRFDQKRYDAITKALSDVCKELDIATPALTTKQVVVPLPDFKSRRWMDFDAETNAKITAVVPNQINFTPLADAAEAEIEGK
jgi:hypothetical protein